MQWYIPKCRRQWENCQNNKISKGLCGRYYTNCSISRHLCMIDVTDSEGYLHYSTQCALKGFCNSPLPFKSKLLMKIHTHT